MQQQADERDVRSDRRDAPVRSLAVLWMAQALIAILVLREFLVGDRYFAYLDIAADTYEIFTSHAMHMARITAREGWSGWSFGLGLGASTAMAAFSDPFRWLTSLGGPDGVLSLRIWVYLAKIMAGGTFFFLLARSLVERREAALLAAIGYSFCGYIVTNGEWDPEANPFVFFPLVCWALVRLLRGRGLVAYPLSVAATLASGIFIVTAIVSLAVACAVSLALAADPRRTARVWLLRVAPLTALGLLIAAPLALPYTLFLLDSPRAGAAGLATSLWKDPRTLFDPQLALLQVGSLFHKDLFGTGSMYRGYMNYLEGPGFYTGLLPLLLAPQLWRDVPAGRRILLVSAAGIALYMLVPALRLAAFAFAVPYFRATTLWVTIGIALVGALAIDGVLRRSVDSRLLAVGASLTMALFGAALWWTGEYAWGPHVWKVGLFLAAWALVLAVSSWRRTPAATLQVAMGCLICVEAVAFAWPSVLGARPTASPRAQPFQDVTVPALEAIRALDGGIYRVEKTFNSISEADAAAQDYFGVKSYYYHGKSLVAFHQGMDMMRRFGFTPPVNHTNWLAAPGTRYVVHSVLGVRYLISKERIDWPGFIEVAAGQGWFAWRNDLAFPLGVVQTRQVAMADVRALAALPPDRQQWFRDLALVNAVVLDELLPAWGTRWDLPGQAASGVVDLPGAYARPAQALQASGLVVSSFRQDRLRGRISPPERGILVFSIPAAPGWSLEIDGKPAPLLRANFGMLAAPVAAGPHDVELSYRMPGLRSGMLLGAAGLLALAGLVLRRRNSRGAGMTG